MDKGIECLALIEMETEAKENEAKAKKAAPPPPQPHLHPYKKKASKTGGGEGGLLHERDSMVIINVAYLHPHGISPFLDRSIQHQKYPVRQKVQTWYVGSISAYSLWHD